MFRSLITALAFAGASMLVGCASVDYKSLADSYVHQFNTNNPHHVLNVQRGGANIHIWEFGAQHRGPLPSIVLMHGFPDSQHLYDPVITELAKSRHVISFDFVGWGDSDKPAGHSHSIASLRADLEAVVQSMQLQNIVLVVHDLSGPPGIDWAMDNQSRVAGLVLLNTYYSPMKSLVPPEAIDRFSTPGLWRDLSVIGASRVDSMWQSGVEEQLDKFFVNAQARAQFVPLFVHQAVQIRPAFFEHNRILRDEIAKRQDSAQRLKDFAKPVLIAFGEDDPYLNQEVAKEFRGLFATPDFQPVPKAAHYVQLDQPQRVAALIADVASRPHKNMTAVKP